MPLLGLSFNCYFSVFFTAITVKCLIADVPKN